MHDNAPPQQTDGDYIKILLDQNELITPIDEFVSGVISIRVTKTIKCRYLQVKFVGKEGTWHTHFETVFILRGIVGYDTQFILPTGRHNFPFKIDFPSFGKSGEPTQPSMKNYIVYTVSADLKSPTLFAGLSISKEIPVFSHLDIAKSRLSFCPVEQTFSDISWIFSDISITATLQRNTFVLRRNSCTRRDKNLTVEDRTIQLRITLEGKKILELKRVRVHLCSKHYDIAVLLKSTTCDTPLTVSVDGKSAHVDLSIPLSTLFKKEEDVPISFTTPRFQALYQLKLEFFVQSGPVMRLPIVLISDT